MEQPSPLIHSHSPASHPLTSPELELSDIEMTPLQSYTSLKDLLLDTPSPPPSAASAWNELPIKNPLLKHAALAYLHPMLTPPATTDGGFMRNLVNHGFGCVQWIGAIVISVARNLSGRGVRRSECSSFR